MFKERWHDELEAFGWVEFNLLPAKQKSKRENQVYHI